MFWLLDVAWKRENFLHGVLGGLSPPKKIWNLFPPHALPRIFSSHKNPSPGCSFHRSHKIVEGRRNYTKIPLSSGEEKHVDTYMVIKITLKKYPNNDDLNP